MTSAILGSSFCCGCVGTCQEFQKLLQPKPGVIIYRHAANVIKKKKTDARLSLPVNAPGALAVTIADQDDKPLSPQPGDRTDSVIVHNAENTSITAEDLLPEFDKLKVTCLRCRHILEQARDLLKQISVVEKNATKGVCDLCKIKQARDPTSCILCEKMGQKLAVNLMREAVKKRLMQTTKITPTEKRGIYSDIDIEKMFNVRDIYYKNVKNILRRPKSGPVLYSMKPHVSYMVSKEVDQEDKLDQGLIVKYEPGQVSRYPLRVIPVEEKLAKEHDNFIREVLEKDLIPRVMHHKSYQEGKTTKEISEKKRAEMMYQDKYQEKPAPQKTEDDKGDEIGEREFYTKMMFTSLEKYDTEQGSLLSDLFEKQNLPEKYHKSVKEKAVIIQVSQVSAKRSEDDIFTAPNKEIKTSLHSPPSKQIISHARRSFTTPYHHGDVEEDKFDQVHPMQRSRSEESLITSFTGITEELFKKQFKYFFPKIIKKHKDFQAISSAMLIKETKDRTRSEAEKKRKEEERLKILQELRIKRKENEQKKRDEKRRRLSEAMRRKRELEQEEKAKQESESKLKLDADGKTKLETTKTTEKSKGKGKKYKEKEEISEKTDNKGKEERSEIFDRKRKDGRSDKSDKLDKKRKEEGSEKFDRKRKEGGSDRLDKKRKEEGSEKFDGKRKEGGSDRLDKKRKEEGSEKTKHIGRGQDTTDKFKPDKTGKTKSDQIKMETLVRQQPSEKEKTTQKEPGKVIDKKISLIKTDLKDEEEEEDEEVIRFVTTESQTDKNKYPPEEYADILVKDKKITEVLQKESKTKTDKIKEEAMADKAKELKLLNKIVKKQEKIKPSKPEAGKKKKESPSLDEKEIEKEDQKKKSSKEPHVSKVKLISQPSGADIITKMIHSPGSVKTVSPGLVIPSFLNLPKEGNIVHPPRKVISQSISEGDSDKESTLAKLRLKKEAGEAEIIVGNKIFLKDKVPVRLEGKEREPIGFHTVMEALGQSEGAITDTSIESKQPDWRPLGIVKYTLSDPFFIENGWTMLPTEKVLRKMNVYRMRPAKPEFDWFKHNLEKGYIEYESGEKLADIREDGRGHWYYKNGRLALDYYDSEEINSQQRFVVYSSGEPDSRGRSLPVTVLAMFDYNGNGVVFDHKGKIRLKYNQTEGVVLDRGIGPNSHWKWHSLNDPPELQQVMVDTEMPHKDPIINMFPETKQPRRVDENMLAIEFDNHIKGKEKHKQSKQKFCPFQIQMKALKINEQFSLRVLDQRTIYLIFREGSTTMKLNLGMILDNSEILDTCVDELGEVGVTVTKFPAATASIEELQATLRRAQGIDRVRTEREQWLRPPMVNTNMTSALSHPRKPLLTLPQESPTSPPAQKYSRISCKGENLYYNTRLI